MQNKNPVTTCSDCPSEAMLWIKEREMVDSLEELKSSRSVAGKNFPKFEMLDPEIASALNKIIQNSYFKKKVSHDEQKVQKEDRFLRGRQIAFMIYDYFRLTGAHDTVLDYAELFSVALHDDNIQEFDSGWDEVLLSMSKIPSDGILESLYKRRIRESAPRKTAWELYDMETSMPTYQILKTMVKRSIDHKLRLRNFDARHGRIETGAVVKNRPGLSGVERGRGVCYQWKEEANVQGETNAVAGMRVTIKHKNRHRKPPHHLSLCVTRSKCVEEKKYPRQMQPWCDSSTTVQILFERYLHEFAL